MDIRVECYAGHRGEETPRAVLFDGRRVEVRKVLDQWPSPGHSRVKMKVGGAELAADVARVAAARAGLGPDVSLFVDAHYTMTETEAATFSDAIAP